MSRASSVSVPSLFPIAIPTNQSFLAQWYPWTAGRVARHFKRDKERCEDTAQNVRLRLLSKNFIGRWFFKHRKDELVDKSQAERILGGVPLAFIGGIQPVYGHRSSLKGYGKQQREMCVNCADRTHRRKCLDAGLKEKAQCIVERPPTGDERENDTSIWRVADLLAYAKFDYERYFYSVQGHTIDSEKILRLLGYETDNYSALESFYRQGRMKPSELTEHQCQEVISPIEKRGDHCGVDDCNRKHYAMGYCSNHYHLSRVRTCPECEHGRELLRQRGLSLSHRWNSPGVADAVRKLRWNDSQLKPYLRDWRKQNLVSATPLYIMRRDPKHGIDAGLLKYAMMVIDHEVVNDFKRMGRADDISMVVLNKGVGPEFSNKENIAWDSDDKESNESTAERVVRDTSALSKFAQVEGWHDVRRLVEAADLTDEESDVMVSIDLGDMSVRQYSDKAEIPVARVHRILTSAHRKLAAQDLPDSVTDEMAFQTASKHGCTVVDIRGPQSFGSCVTARTELFSTLYDIGMTIPGIAARFSIPEERVSAAINRSVLREGRHEYVG